MPHALEPKKRLLPSIRPRAHSVNLLEYADGRLLATWFTGSSEGTKDQVAVASVLHGQKNEWSAPGSPCVCSTMRGSGGCQSKPVPLRRIAAQLSCTRGPLL